MQLMLSRFPVVHHPHFPNSDTQSCILNCAHRVLQRKERGQRRERERRGHAEKLLHSHAKFPPLIPIYYILFFVVHSGLDVSNTHVQTLSALFGFLRHDVSPITLHTMSEIDIESTAMEAKKSSCLWFHLPYIMH